MDASDPRLPPIFPATGEGLQAAAAALRRKEVIAYPTETLYGLGALALDSLALSRLLALKGRSEKQPLSLLVCDLQMLLTLVQRIPQAAQSLIDRFWPGPLTLVLPARPALPAALVNERGGVGVRLSPDPVAQSLLGLMGAPLTATSANPSGAPAATEASAARLSGLALVLDDGPRRGAPSTVVEVLERPVVLRRGSLALPELEGGGPA